MGQLQNKDLKKTSKNKIECQYKLQYGEACKEVVRLNRGIGTSTKLDVFMQKHTFKQQGDNTDRSCSNCGKSNKMERVVCNLGHGNSINRFPATETKSCNKMVIGMRKPTKSFALLVYYSPTLISASHYFATGTHVVVILLITYLSALFNSCLNVAILIGCSKGIQRKVNELFSNR